MTKSVLKWSPAEYDIIAKAALAANLPPKTSRVNMLREGQKALPEDRQKVLPDHLGGKSFNGFKAALARVLKGRQGGANKGKVTHSADDPFEGTTRHTKKAVKPPAQRQREQRAARPGAVEARQTQQRSAAKKARKAMKELRKTLHGQGERLAIALQRAGKTPMELAHAMNVHDHTINALLRDPTKTMMTKNVARAATILGCNYGWLYNGVEADMPQRFRVAQTVELAMREAPAKAPRGPVVRANGHLHHRAQANLEQNLDAAMQALWPMAEPDVKAHFVARLSELVANARR